MEQKEERLARGISAFSRREILRLIADKKMTVTEIAEKTNQSVSLASRHLKLLYDLGFLNVKVSYPNKLYSIKVKDLKELLDIYDKVIKKL